MNIGDRVRLMHGKEEGIITRFLENNLVEVAIDNDFTIPVMRREVVVIAAEEEKMFRSAPAAAAPAAPQRAAREAASLPSQAVATAGFYAALVQQTPELLALTLINNTDYDVLFTYGEEKNGRYRGILNDRLPAKQTKIAGHFHLKDFDQWPSLVFQFLLHRTGAPNPLEPVLRKLHFKASTFYKSKKTAPVLKKEAYLFQLDEQKAKPIDAGKIVEKLQEPDTAEAAAFKLAAPEHEVDLHIPTLSENYGQMSNSEILKLQLSVFQDKLDRAIAANMHEIIFIHGTGNGVLRKEIHKLLSRNRDIKFYEDARKDKFGFGATLVKIR